nr:hypothetical protein [Tanacetum cinerariifolium]
MEDRVMLNNSKGKKQEVEDQRRNVKLSKNKTSITASNDIFNVKTLNVNFVCATCGKCVLHEKHDMCFLKFVNGVISRTKMPIAVPISTREPKCTVQQSVAKPIRKTVDRDSNQKPRNITRKLYERVSEGKPRKGQNRIKTEQKKGSVAKPESVKAISAKKERKNEENKKRKAKIANSYKVIKERRKIGTEFAI